MAAKIKDVAEATETKVEGATEELVEILIPLSDDVNAPNYEIASCNGRVFKIQKGVPVKVPVEIKEIIDRSNRAKMELRKSIQAVAQ